MPEAADWRAMMKRWKQYSLFLLLLVSGLLLTGAGAAGEHTIYADYSRQNGWMTPVVSLVFQGLKDGTGPWELFFGAVQTSAEPGESEQEPETVSGEGESADSPAESGMNGSSPDGNEAAGAISGNDISGNTVSENMISQNGITGNSIAEKDSSGSGNSSGQIPEKGEEKGDDVSAPAFIASDGRQYDQFGQLIGAGEDTGVSDAMPEKITGMTPEENMQSQAETDASQQDESTQPNQSAQGEEDGLQTGNEQGGSGQDGSGPQNGEEAASEAQENEDSQWTGTFTQVPESYFDDALFIGDSRTVGLDEYGGFQESTTFFAKTSLTIYDLFEEPEKFASLADGTKATLEEALTERKFGKIYIMLGINELGRGTTESFFTTYAEAVNRIRVLQPDALIFIQGIMRVGEEKNNTDRIFNNANINERNQAISLMADNRNIYYLEINDAVCDENGNLISDYTFDQIHLKAKYYQLWKDYLFAHGILKS